MTPRKASVGRATAAKAAAGRRNQKKLIPEEPVRKLEETEAKIGKRKTRLLQLQ